jgi:hypothetical protein
MNKKIQINLKTLTAKMLFSLIIASSSIGFFISGSAGAASLVTDGVYAMPAIGSNKLDIGVGGSDSESGTVVFVLDTSQICEDAEITGMRVTWNQSSAPGNGRNDGLTSDMQGIFGYFFYDSLPANKVAIDSDNYNPLKITAPSNPPEMFGLYWDPNGIRKTVDVSYDLTSFTRSQIDGMVAFFQYSYDNSTMIDQGLDPSLLPSLVTMEVPQITFTYDNSSCPVVATDPDISTTPSSTPVTINILGNDTGTNLNVSKIDNQTIASGDTITLSNGSGIVKLNTDGTITFTPNSTFSGESIFSYSITDGASTVDTGVVRITVAATTTTNTTTTTTTPSTPTASTTSTNSTKVLAKTGQSTITALALATLSLVGAVLAKARRARV